MPHNGVVTTSADTPGSSRGPDEVEPDHDVADDRSDFPSAVWARRWEAPGFRLIMNVGFTFISIVNSLEHDGVWRLFWWVLAGFFLVGAVGELHAVARRRRAPRQPRHHSRGP